MKKILSLLALFASMIAFSQAGIGTMSPDASAVLDVVSTTKGFLPPRMTQSQMNAINNPITGLVVYCTDCTPKGLHNYVSPNWVVIKGGNASPIVVSDCTANGFSGTYIAGIATTATFSVTVTNNSFITASIAFQNSDLALSGVNGLSVTATSPATATLTSGQSQIVTYTVTGTPQTTGTLTGTWSKLTLTCTDTQAVTGISTAMNANYCNSALFNGGYVSNFALTAGNTFTVSFTNTSGSALSGLPAPTASNLALTWSGTGTISVASVTPSGTYSLAAGATRTFTYTLSGQPTSTGTLTGEWTYSDLTCTKTAAVTGISGAINANYCDGALFNGAYVSGVAFNSSNTFTVTITNTSGSALNGFPAPLASNLALTWTGTGSLTTTLVSPTTTFNIAAGASQTFTYRINGTPTSTGTLTGAWTYGDLTCTKVRNIGSGDATFPNASNNQYVFSVNDSGLPLNSQGTLAIGTTINVPYTGGVGNYIAYTSPAVAIPSQFCEDGATDWTLGYSYSAGSFSASGNIVVTLITRKAGTITAWQAKRVANITTINFNCVAVPWSVNGNAYSNTIGIDEGGDAIRGALSTSGAAYDAAAVNNIIRITEAEYNNMNLIVPGTATMGKQVITDGAGGLGALTWTVDGNGTTWKNLASNSYIFGFAYAHNSGSATTYYRMGSASTVSGTVTPLTNYSGPFSTTSGTYHFYAVKRPTIHCGINTFITASSSADMGGRNITGGTSYYNQTAPTASEITATGTNLSSWTPTVQVKSSTQKSW